MLKQHFYLIFQMFKFYNISNPLYKSCILKGIQFFLKPSSKVFPIFFYFFCLLRVFSWHRCSPTPPTSPLSQYIYCGGVITEILSYRALRPPFSVYIGIFSAAILYLLLNIVGQILSYEQQTIISQILSYRTPSALSLVHYSLSLSHTWATRQ